MLSCTSVVVVDANAEHVGDLVPVKMKVSHSPPTVQQLAVTTTVEVLAVLASSAALSASGVYPHGVVYAMRPLTCYPDAGTGDGFPFVLADYLLPATMEKSLQWSNTMSGPPAAYELALQTAMAHFDSAEILHLKQEGAYFTTEQP